MLKRGILLIALAVLAVLLVSRPAFQTVAAGVAIFLFGMLFMEQGFHALTGGALERVLARATNNLAKSQLFGFITTAVMQSSSLITAMTISTITAGLISLSAGIGIIFGANIGTTTGAWIMAGFGLKVDIAHFAMPLIVLGLVLVFQRKREVKGVGYLLAGIGFVFLGIHYMKEGFEVFSEAFDLSQYAVPGLLGLLIYTGIGMLATVVMQSSHATLMITIAALAAGQVTYDNAIALVIGSNIGTTITAILGALGANVQGKRLAVAHVAFNVITGAIALIFIGPFKWAVDGIADAFGLAEDNWTLRLATFHTLFNIVGVMVMTPFLGVLVRSLERWVKPRARTVVEGVVLEPQYLNEPALALPDTALEVLVLEARHLLTNVFEVVVHGLNLHRTDILSERDLAEVIAESTEVMDIDVDERYRQSVKTLYSAIIDFATRAPVASNMNQPQLVRVQNVRLACRNAAEIIKHLVHIRDNLNSYMNAGNAAMQTQYNQIRHHIATILRQMVKLRESTDAAEITAMLEAMERQVAKMDALANGTIDGLVRERTITPSMATSLINDTFLASAVCRGLTEIAQNMAVARGVLTPTP